MKTSVEIPDKELRDVLRFTKAKTKREAITTAIVDFNRRQRLQALAADLGTLDGFMTPADLRKMRRGKAWSHGKAQSQDK